MVSYLSLSPAQITRRLSNSVANCIFLDGLKLLKGAFVVYEEGGRHSVGKVIEIEYGVFVNEKEVVRSGINKKISARQKICLVQKYECMSNLSIKLRKERPPADLCDSLPDSLREVVETGKVRWIEDKYIFCTALVFHPDDIVSKNLQCIRHSLALQVLPSRRYCIEEPAVPGNV